MRVGQWMADKKVLTPEEWDEAAARAPADSSRTVSTAMLLHLARRDEIGPLFAEYCRADDFTLLADDPRGHTPYAVPVFVSLTEGLVLYQKRNETRLWLGTTDADECRGKGPWTVSERLMDILPAHLVGRVAWFDRSRANVAICLDRPFKAMVDARPFERLLWECAEAQRGSDQARLLTKSLELVKWVNGRIDSSSARDFASEIVRTVKELCEEWRSARALELYRQGLRYLWGTPRPFPHPDDGPNSLGRAVYPMPPLWAFVETFVEAFSSPGDRGLIMICEDYLRWWRESNSYLAAMVARRLDSKRVVTTGATSVLSEAAEIAKKSKEKPAVSLLEMPGGTTDLPPHMARGLDHESFKRMLPGMKAEQKPEILYIGCPAWCRKYGYFCREGSRGVVESCEGQSISTRVAVTTDKECTLCKDRASNTLQRLCATVWVERFLQVREDQVDTEPPQIVD